MNKDKYTDKDSDYDASVTADEDDFEFDSDDSEVTNSENISADTEHEDNFSFDTEDDFNDYPDNDDDFEILPDDEDEEENFDKHERKKIKREERRANRRNFFRRVKKPALITAAAIASAFVILFIFSLLTITPDKIMKNVYIENVDVGGYTYDEALETVNSTYLLSDKQITLINGEKTFTINGADVGLSALPEETVQKAMDYCKGGNFLQNGFKSLKLIFKEHVIVPAPQLDTNLLDAKLNEFGNEVLGELKQHYIELGDDGMVTVYSGRTGYNGNPEAAREAVLNAISNEQFTFIPVTYETAPPDDMTIESFDALVYKDPVDARYEIDGNSVTIVPGDTGRYINKDEAAPLLQNVYEGCEPVRIPFYVSQPEKTSDLLRAKLFETTLSSYSTSYGSSNSNRRANISRAASLINGTVVAPGDVFSFNDTVGSRTTSNGFYTAKEYVDGKSVDGIGGGVCQVSSTLYSAVLYADMSIVERLNHMMTVGYIPLGQDATVSDGGVDFRFKNTSDYPIKISAYTSGATITISIIGAAWEPDRDVKVVNNTTTSGENTVVYSTRYVYSNGELISTDTLNSSTYMPPKPTEG